MRNLPSKFESDSYWLKPNVYMHLMCWFDKRNIPNWRFNYEQKLAQHLSESSVLAFERTINRWRNLDIKSLSNLICSSHEYECDLSIVRNQAGSSQMV